MYEHLRSRGFTLIELMVVISIISVLSSTTMVFVNDARIKARDAKRVSDMSQIQNALELYFSKYGYYPDVNDTWVDDISTRYVCPSAASGLDGYDVEPRDGYDCTGYRVSYNSANWNKLQTALAEFLPKLPVDPVNNCTDVPWRTGTPLCFTYFYGNVGRYTYAPRYDLVATLEDPSNPMRSEVKNYRWRFDALYWNGYPKAKYFYDAGDKLQGY